MKPKGKYLVGTGWAVLMAVCCAAERLMDSLAGWGIALTVVFVACGLMKLGEVANSWERN